MSKAGWNNFLNNLPDTLQKLSALCIGAEMLRNRSCCCGMGYSIFPMSYNPYPTYMPYQTQYSPYSMYPTSIYQYPAYQSPYPSAPADSTYLPIQTQITSADAVSNEHSQNLGNNMLNRTDTEFVSDNWKTLDAKTGKTQLENLQLSSKYTDFLSNLSKSFITALDNQELDSKDGYISKNEFIIYYLNQFDNLTDETELQEKQAEAEKIFNNLDLTKEGKLDWKELSAFMALADKSGAEGQYNGKISHADLMTAFSAVKDINESGTNILKQNYGQLFNTQA